MFWPGLVIMDAMGWEQLTMPAPHIIGFVIGNALFGHTLSDMIWAKVGAPSA